jgi:hypothetical protein
VVGYTAEIDRHNDKEYLRLNVNASSPEIREVFDRILFKLLKLPPVLAAAQKNSLLIEFIGSSLSGRPEDYFFKRHIEDKRILGANVN